MQDEAIKSRRDAVRRSRAGGSTSSGALLAPLSSLGTTGVGKTELAKKALAEYLFDDEDMMTRIDHAEYQEKALRITPCRSASGIRRLRRADSQPRPCDASKYSVVLFDEIESPP